MAGGDYSYLGLSLKDKKIIQNGNIKINKEIVYTFHKYPKEHPNLKRL